MKRIFWIGMLALLLAACGSAASKDDETTSGGMGGGMGMGMGGGMMERHHAQIPEEYASLENSVPAEERR